MRVALLALLAGLLLQGCGHLSCPPGKVPGGDGYCITDYRGGQP